MPVTTHTLLIVVTWAMSKNLLDCFFISGSFSIDPRGGCYVVLVHQAHIESHEVRLFSRFSEIENWEIEEEFYPPFFDWFPRLYRPHRPAIHHHPSYPPKHAINHMHDCYLLPPPCHCWQSPRNTSQVFGDGTIPSFLRPNELQRHKTHGFLLRNGLQRLVPRSTIVRLPTHH